MNKLIIGLLIFLQGAIALSAGEWSKRYLQDVFGDNDYSQPVYTTELYGSMNLFSADDPCMLGIIVKPEQGSAIIKCFLKREGYAQHFFSDTKAYIKLSNGQKYSIPCVVDNSGDLWIGESTEELNAFINIIDKGYYTLAIKSINSTYGDQFTATFKVTTQTTGIKQLVGGRSQSPAASSKVTFKGTLGQKYDFTMVFDQPESIFETGGKLTGTYWYGSGKNGKMTVKGTIDQRGNIELTEYDPSGKKCGTWYMNILSDDSGTKYALDGFMTNAKGQNFHVDATQK